MHPSSCELAIDFLQKYVPLMKQNEAMDDLLEVAHALAQENADLIFSRLAK